MCGQGEPECCSLTGLAFYADLVMMQLDDDAADVEAEAQTSLSAASDFRVGDSIKSLEQVRHGFCRDAFPFVMHSDPRLALLLAQTHGDRAIFPRVLDGIRQQIADDLRNAFRVNLYRHRPGWQFKDDVPVAD